jgi:trehalose synthase
VAALMAEGDTRWIERGAYDLVDRLPDAKRSAAGLPKARMLYGSLAAQLQQPDSFAMQLKHLLAVRQNYGIAASRQVAIPDVVAPGLLVMIHELPDARGTQITALNFGATAIRETILLPNMQSGPVVDMLKETVLGDFPESGELAIELDPYEGVSLRVVSVLRTIA